MDQKRYIHIISRIFDKEILLGDRLLSEIDISVFVFGCFVKTQTSKIILLRLKL